MTIRRWLLLSGALAVALGCGGVDAETFDAAPPDARDPATIPPPLEATVTGGGGPTGGSTDLPNTSKAVLAVGQAVAGTTSGGGQTIEFGLLPSVKAE